ncbi:RNA polymerase sigma factor [Nocardioides speluncae]|uniref:RNA polymerase sigma factor n=1 Tax=Nocardioides speluncae TaxID=2670337 RepID=UPI000D69F4F6|nr:sigma-70 family RNA polymerase sigma factor [Nocardioides speluncae]
MEDIERAFREAHGPAVATLVRVFGDISLAEDAVQEAFAAAVERWPRDGMPDNPAGWIVRTARNAAVDVVRRDARGRELVAQAAREHDEAVTVADVTLAEEDDVSLRDDQLRLIFTCCHPALCVEHQVALTLRLVAGLNPGEVARAFLVSEATMAKRLVRARYKIKAAHIPYRVPGDGELPARLRPVLSVLYLVYNTGSDDREGRTALRTEAIRLARTLATLMPDEPEVLGLLALMLLNEARLPARGPEVTLLRDQDRSRWNRPLIREGHDLAVAALRHPRPGPFALQAAIQGAHCAAATFQDTDWPAILRLYDRLVSVMPTPVVRLNRAIVVAEVDGPAAALSLVEAIMPELAGYYLLHATRASLLERLGRIEEAQDAYRRAGELAPSAAETRFLVAKQTAMNKFAAD